MEARIVELAALFIILACMAQGWYRGLLMKVYSLIRFILLLVAAIILVPILLPMFPSDLTGKEGIALCISLLVAAILLHCLEKVLKLVEKLPVVSTVNKLGGAVLGGIFGIALVWLLLLLAGSLQEVAWCRQLTEYIRESEILMAVYQFNPLSYIMGHFDFPVL